MKNLEAPIYWAPQKKLGGGWIAFKDSPAVPQAPDPTVTANAQTQSNIATANANAALNRVNQYTPWGSLTYTRTQGAPTFDQAGYDAAMKKYNDAYSQWQASQSYNNSGDDNPYWARQAANAGPAPAAPNRADFMTLANSPDQWSSTITLAPEQQKLLDSSNRISQDMADLGEKQLGTVNSTLSQPLNFSGAPTIQNNALQTGVNSPGDYTRNVSYGNIQDRVANAGPIQRNLDLSNVPGLVGGDALGKAMQDAQQAAYKQQTAYLDPQWQQQQHDLENQLAQQGVMQNSDAWNRAMDDFQRNKTFAYNQALQSAIGLGNAAQNQLFQQGLSANQNAYGQALGTGNFVNSAQAQQYGQNATDMQLANAAQQQGFAQALQNAQLNNSVNDTLFNRGLMNAQLNNAASGQAFAQSQAARNQAINEIMAQRQNPLNELNALRTGSQVTTPQFAGVPQSNVAGTDIAGLINQNYANQLGAYNSQVAQNNAFTNGLFNLGAAYLMKGSDRSIKQNIVKLGTRIDGIGVYQFEYKPEYRNIWGHGTHVGVMADEVEMVMPSAVATHEDGYKVVNYGML